MLAGAVDECAFCGTCNWCERRKDGRPQCYACRAERFFENVLLKPIGKSLIDWQRKILRDIYGAVDLETGLRRYREAYITMAKKNGKSFLIAGIPLYHMMIESQYLGQQMKIFGAASNKRQASIVYDHAADIVQRNPILASQIKLTRSTKTMSTRDGRALYSVLACIDGGNEGIEPHVNIQDEIHEWTSAAAVKTNVNMMYGTRSVEQPLTVRITTAGERGRSELWEQADSTAKQILSGTLKSDRFYAARWCADESRLREEPDYWKSREARVAANPSHEDLGGFLKDEVLEADLQEAIHNPAKYNDYVRYTLNLAVSNTTRYLSAEAWSRCGVERRATIGRRCIAGLDLSETLDITALVLLFPDDDKTFDVLSYFWMPGDNVERFEREHRIPYGRWVREGLIEASEGRVVDYDAVKAKIDWAKQNFDVECIAYDPWHASQLIEAKGGLIDQGYNCIKIPQNYQMLSEPTKALSVAVATGRLRHGRNEVLTWMADCAMAKSDGKDNVMLAKPDRRKETKRIDGIAALVNAFAMWTREQNTESVYETRGFATL